MGSRRDRGGALLAVLWLAAALSAIAFTVAHTVRGETERAATAADGLRAYYLATAGIERALLWMTWSGNRNPDNTPRYWENGMPLIRFTFPTGETVVELIPETSRLNLNTATEDDLLRLAVLLGTDPNRAASIAAAVVDWRTPAPDGGPLDPYYLSLTPSFRPAHASFQEIEELLLVRGMTPELFYGSTDRTPDGRLIFRPGLRDCVSVFGSSGSGIDVNTAEPVVMQAVGIPADLVAAIVARRSVRPYKTEELPALIQASPSLQRLTVGGATIYTLRSTARLRTSDGTLTDIRRSVAAQAKLLTTPIYGRPYQIMRWYDNSPRVQ